MGWNEDNSIKYLGPLDDGGVKYLGPLEDESVKYLGPLEKDEEVKYLGPLEEIVLDEPVEDNQYINIIQRASETYNVDSSLIKSMIAVESAGKIDAVSGKGAGGLMQLMPATAKELGVTDVFDPEQNIMGGAKYIRQMLDRFDGNETLALAAYNAGAGNVKKYGGVPPFPETKNYVERVLSGREKKDEPIELKHPDKPVEKEVLTEKVLKERTRASEEYIAKVKKEAAGLHPLSGARFMLSGDAGLEVDPETGYIKKDGKLYDPADVQTVKKVLGNTVHRLGDPIEEDTPPTFVPETSTITGKLLEEQEDPTPEFLPGLSDKEQCEFLVKISDKTLEKVNMGDLKPNAVEVYKKRLEQSQAAEGTPWVDPAMVVPAAGITTGILTKGGVKVATKAGVKAGTKVGIAEPFLGTATEEIAGDSPAALAVNLLLGGGAGILEHKLAGKVKGLVKPKKAVKDSAIKKSAEQTGIPEEEIRKSVEASPVKKAGKDVVDEDIPIRLDDEGIPIIPEEPPAGTTKHISKGATREGVSKEEFVKKMELDIEKEKALEKLKNKVIKEFDSAEEAVEFGKKATPTQAKQLKKLAERAEIEEEVALFKSRKPFLPEDALKHSGIQHRKANAKARYKAAYGAYRIENIPKTTKAMSTSDKLKHKLGAKKRDIEERGFDLVGKRREGLGVAAYRTNLFVEKFERELSKQQREVIPFLLEKTDIPDSLPKLKKVFEKDPDKLIKAAGEIKTYFDEGWTKIVKAIPDMSNKEIENYVTHIWNVPSDKKIEVGKWFISNKNKFLNERHISTIKEGMEKFDLTPRTLDIVDIIRIHDAAGNKAIQNTAFIKGMKNLEKQGISLIQPAAHAPNTWKTLEHPILTNVVFGARSKTGKRFGLKEGKFGKIAVKVHPEILKPLKVVLGSRHESEVMKAYENINEFVKKAWLSVSLFHHGALTETAMATIGPIKTAKIWSDGLWRIARHCAGASKKPLPIFSEEFKKTAEDAIQHGLQVGATKDIARGKIQRWLDGWAESQKWWLKNPPARAVLSSWAKTNKVWDKALWDYLHDTFKLYAYKTLTADRLSKTSKVLMKKQKREIANFVNDTFGGQNWDRVTPKQLQVARWSLLSPDWTWSTAKQALAITGFGKTHKETASIRKKMGLVFCTKVMFYFGAGITLLNGTLREFDMRNHPEKYKGQKLTPFDYTTFANAPGHKTHLFVGRYEDGTERYLRWGKQFRELPELASHPFKKLGGKAAPALTTLTEMFTGSSLSGFRDEDLSNKEGLDFAKGMLKKSTHLLTPFALQSWLDPNKEVKVTDIIYPSSKGMTRYKAKDLYKKAIKNNNFADIEKISKHAVRNNLPIDALFKQALTDINREETIERNKKIKSIEEAEKMHKKAKTYTEKKAAITLIKRLKKEKYDIDQGLEQMKKLRIRHNVYKLKKAIK